MKNHIHCDLLVVFINFMHIHIKWPLLFLFFFLRPVMMAIHIYAQTQNLSILSVSIISSLLVHSHFKLRVDALFCCCCFCKLCVFYVTFSLIKKMFHYYKNECEFCCVFFFSFSCWRRARTRLLYAFAM